MHFSVVEGNFDPRRCNSIHAPNNDDDYDDGDDDGNADANTDDIEPQWLLALDS